MAVSLATSAAGLDVSAPTALFDIAVSPGARQQYDVTGDGQRFLVNAVTVESETPVTIVLNWAAGLRK